jgi:hypothetical protein
MPKLSQEDIEAGKKAAGIELDELDISVPREEPKDVSFIDKAKQAVSYPLTRAVQIKAGVRPSAVQKAKPFGLVTDPRLSPVPPETTPTDTKQNIRNMSEDEIMIQLKKSGMSPTPGFAKYMKGLKKQNRKIQDIMRYMDEPTIEHLKKQAKATKKMADMNRLKQQTIGRMYDVLSKQEREVFKPNRKKMERKAQDAIADKQKKVDAIDKKIKKFQIDPARLWKKDQGMMILATIGVFLAGLGDAIARRPVGQHYKIIEGAIQRDIASQRADYEKMKGQRGDAMNLWGLAKEQFEDDKLAHEALKMNYLDQIQNETKKNLDKIGTMEAQAGAEVLISELEKEKGNIAQKVALETAVEERKNYMLEHRQVALYNQQQIRMKKEMLKGLAKQKPYFGIRPLPGYRQEELKLKTFDRVGSYMATRDILNMIVAWRNKRGSETWPQEMTAKIETWFGNMTLERKDGEGFGAALNDQEVKLMYGAIGAENPAEYGWVETKLKAGLGALKLRTERRLNALGYGLAEPKMIEESVYRESK